MILPGGRFQVFVATRPVDFRKGMDGLAAVVQQQLRLDPFGGAVFVFRAKRADRVKILVWDGSGLMLIYKRLEEGKFCWPRIEDGGPAGRVVRGARLEAGPQPSGAPAAPRPVTCDRVNHPLDQKVTEEGGCDSLRP